MDDLTIEHPDLEEYLDGGGGGLPPEVRAHLARCRACTEELAALAELRRRARDLPHAIEPGQDLWQGIAARIGGTPSQGDVVAGAKVVPLRRKRVVVGRQRWLAAAAVVLIVAASGTTALLLRGAPAADGTVAATRPTSGANPVGLAAFASSQPEYSTTVEALEAQLAARRGELSPATIRIVEENLLIIDNAIDEARRALAADPTSADLPLLLSGVYRQKVELLRQAVELTARS